MKKTRKDISCSRRNCNHYDKCYLGGKALESKNYSGYSWVSEHISRSTDYSRERSDPSDFISNESTHLNAEAKEIIDKLIEKFKEKK